MERVPIVIVGGGLAGSATALHLARAGHDVRILERGSFPREKVCGEGLMPHGVHELDALGLLQPILDTEPEPFVGIGYHVGKTRAEGVFPKGATGLGVRRSRIDEVLYEACQREPRIEVRTGVRVTDVQRDSQGVTLKTSEGRCEAQVVVGADGLGSLVRRKAGLKKAHPSPPRYGARMHVTLGHADAASRFVEVFLGDALEWYITPTGTGEANIALLCEKSVSKQFGGDLDAALWRLVEQEPRLAPWAAGAQPLTAARLCGPLRQEVRSSATDRVVLVGDAAGFVDAITGEGMSLSLLEARLAAGVISQGLAANDLSARSLLRYHRQRQRASRSLVWFTRLILWGLRRRRLARHVITNLARHPEAFSRLLGVNIGQRAMWNIAPRDVVRLLAGV